MPLVTAMISVANANFTRERYAASTPSTNSGIELPSMCAQEKCRNGAVKIVAAAGRCRAARCRTDVSSR